jgi:transcriptional regulator with XRE-family HTH domain
MTTATVDGSAAPLEPLGNPPFREGSPDGPTLRECLERYGHDMINAAPATSGASTDCLNPQQRCDAFGERLCLLRNRKGQRISQAKLAEGMTALGVPTHPATIARIEGGAQAVRLAEVYAAALVLEVSVETLLDLEPPRVAESTARAVAQARAAELERIREGFAEWVDGRLVALRREIDGSGGGEQ